MTTLTIKINESTKAGKAFMTMTETFFKDAKGVEIIDNSNLDKPKMSAKEIAFYKKFETAVKQSKEIAIGKSKGKLLKDTLDEI